MTLWNCRDAAVMLARYKRERPDRSASRPAERAAVPLPGRLDARRLIPR